MKYFKLFAIYTLLLCYGSCATFTSEQENEELFDPTNKRILVEKKITEQVISDPLFAAQLIEYYRQQQSLFLSAELDVFNSSLQQVLSKNLNEHLEENRFEDAIALFHSMQKMNYPIQLLSSVNEILYLAVLWHLEHDNYLPLLFNMSHMSNYSVFSADTLDNILDIALRHNHRVLIRKIIDNIVDFYPSLAQRYNTALQKPLPTLNEMLEGTATVWVDKGFTITDGVGHPDRVFGSAFFVDQRGYLITNYHVIASEVDPEYEGFSRLYIRLSNNSDIRVPAKVVGYDRLLDIALLKTEIVPEFIFPVEEYTQPYTQGQQVYALGSPIGLDKSITFGIISSASRRFLPIGETLQIDASVNPGNSGGPLVSTNGEVLGVVYAGLPQFQGINFAIPIKWVWQSIPSLFSVVRNDNFWLGIAVKEVRNHLEVIYVMPNSAADEAGIKIGDVLTRINNKPVRHLHIAQAEIASFHSQALFAVDWIIDGNLRRYLMKTQPRPFSPIEEAFDFQKRELLFTPLFGMIVNRLGGIRSNKYIIDKIYSGSIADELGFSPADPFTLLSWNIDEELRIVQMRINIRKAKNGFTPSVLQLFSRIDLPNFI